MPRHTPSSDLTPEQKAESDRIFATLQQATADDLRALADLLATTDDSTTFGTTEYAVRDIVLGVGAKALETTLEGRKKGGTTGPVGRARRVTNRPASNGGEPSPS
jgi:hypothetical protein